MCDYLIDRLPVYSMSNIPVLRSRQGVEDERYG